LYFFWNPTEGPFIIIPCLEKEGAQTKYSLTCTNLHLKSLNSLIVYSNNPLSLEQLDQERNQVKIGEWNELTDGGCELHTKIYEKNEISKQTWANNP